MRALKSYGLAALLLIVLAGWLGTGTFLHGGHGPHDSEMRVVELVEQDGGLLTNTVDASGFAKSPHNHEGVDDPALSIAERITLAASLDDEIRSVRTRRFEISEMPLSVTLRGATAADGSVDAAVRTSDLVTEMHVSIGQRVETGDPICSLDNGTREASVDQAHATVVQAEAALLQAQSDFTLNAALLEKDLVSANSVDAVAARLRSAEANLEAAAVMLRNREVERENTEVRATVSGVVQRPVAKVGDLLNLGQSCAKIIQLDPMVFVGAVPQVRISQARAGLSAEIRTINGETAQGVVRFVSSSANTATRTFEIEIEFANPDGAILDGLTAEAVVNLGTAPAHLIPQSIMTLNRDGVLGVRGVEDSVVVFYPVSILQDTRDGAWVDGLPDQVEIIVIGQEYVTADQTVLATLEQEG